MSDLPTSESESALVCDCNSSATDLVKASMRSACVGKPFYEYEGKRYRVLHFPSEEKSADFKRAIARKRNDKDFNFCGAWFPDGISFGGWEFTSAANFDHATFSANADFMAAIFKAEAYFGNAIFRGEAYFNVAIFSKEAAANFNSAIFSARAFFNSAIFGGAVYFTSASFNAEAYFNHAAFSKKETAFFGSTTFGGAADFSSATFSAKADFKNGTFSAEANFSGVTFSAEANFSGATFVDYVRFEGDKKREVFGCASSLDLQFATIKDPHQVFFHTVTLRPQWFVNVDARGFNFISVEWSDASHREVGVLRRKEGDGAYRLLALAYRQLAVNAEENHRYEEASRFRYLSMDMRRQRRMKGWNAARTILTRCSRSLRRDWGLNGRTLTRFERFARAYWRTLDLRQYWASRDFLHWIYWLLSGYEERIYRAFVILTGIWFIFALMYARVRFAPLEPNLSSASDASMTKRDAPSEPLPLKLALTYSAGVMTLQKPEPRPATTAAQSVVILETVLGPVQAALLALAIRRKFMR